MMRKIGWMGWGLLGCVLSAGAAEYLSPEYVAAAPDGKSLYVTCAGAGKILRVDAAGAGKTAEWKTAARPGGIAAAKDGTLFVAAGGADGLLLKYSPGGEELGRARVGHTPIAPVVSPDGKSVFVACRFDNAVVRVDAETMQIREKARAVREPHAMALGAGGRLLFAANLLPLCRATNDVVAAAVSVFDLSAPGMPVKNIPLPNGSTGVRGMCASPDGAFIYVTHTFGRFHLPTTQLERGWMNTAGLSVLDGRTGAYVNTALLDDVDLGAANPWGAAVSGDGGTLAVAHAGTREISLIDRAALHDRLGRAAKNEQVTEVTRAAENVPNDLSFLAPIRRRFLLDGDGPRGLAFAGKKLFAALYFTDALGVIDTAAANPAPALARLAPAPDLTKDRTRRGELLWNDASMCFQHWQSCASCHPDARMDGLNWDLLNDGMGNPKQSKSLVYCHLTPPAMVTGIRPGMKSCNRKGITHIQFVVRPEEDALCLDDYVMSLKPVPGPGRGKGALSAAAERGEKLFRKAGCAMCHSDAKTGPAGEKLYTNLMKFDLGLGIDDEKGRQFDTPTLTECWRTAPYLYDGRALTIEEVLTVCNPDDTHGRTKDLTPEQIKDLAAYVRSL